MRTRAFLVGAILFGFALLVSSCGGSAREGKVGENGGATPSGLTLQDILFAPPEGLEVVAFDLEGNPLSSLPPEIELSEEGGEVLLRTRQPTTHLYAVVKQPVPEMEPVFDLSGTEGMVVLATEPVPGVAAVGIARPRLDPLPAGVEVRIRFEPRRAVKSFSALGAPNVEYSGEFDGLVFDSGAGRVKFSERLKGDGDQSHDVGFNDMTLLVSNFGLPAGLGAGQAPPPVDYDNSGDIGFNDATIVVSNFGQFVDAYQILQGDTDPPTTVVDSFSIPALNSSTTTDTLSLPVDSFADALGFAAYSFPPPMGALDPANRYIQVVPMAAGTPDPSHASPVLDLLGAPVSLFLFLESPSLSPQDPGSPETAGSFDNAYVFAADGSDFPFQFSVWTTSDKQPGTEVTSEVNFDLCPTFFKLGTGNGFDDTTPGQLNGVSDPSIASFKVVAYQGDPANFSFDDQCNPQGFVSISNELWFQTETGPPS